MTLPVRQITSRHGVVIEGADISAEPTGGAIAALRGVLNEHKVIVFDGVELDVVGQGRVASWLGELTTAHPTVPAVPGTTSVLTVDSGTSKSSEWQTTTSRGA